VPERGRVDRGTGMSCGGGSLIGNEEVLVSDHPPLIMSRIEPNRKPWYSSG